MQWLLCHDARLMHTGLELHLRLPILTPSSECVSVRNTIRVPTHVLLNVLLTAVIVMWTHTRRPWGIAIESLVQADSVCIGIDCSRFGALFTECLCTCLLSCSPSPRLIDAPNLFSQFLQLDWISPPCRLPSLCLARCIPIH